MTTVPDGCRRMGKNTYIDHNELTRRLLAQGYTRENYPDYVCWGDWQNFTYKWEFLKEMVWESPCGLLSRPDDPGWTAFGGVDYCAENNNPLLPCPHRRKSCPHYRDIHPGLSCVLHLTERPYDYEQSVEKLENDRDAAVHKNWFDRTGGVYCACCRTDQDSLKCIGRYDVEECIRWGCQNEVCVIRKCKRNLSKVHVVYDTLREWRRVHGFLDETRRAIEKGVRVFPAAIARTDAEIWLKQRQRKSGYEPFVPRYSGEDRSQEWFSNMHRTYKGEDLFEFRISGQNLRIAGTRQNTRDLFQDLADAAAGIEVTHSGDSKKAAKQQKHERRVKARQSKVDRLERLILENGFGALEELDQIRAEKKLDPARIDELDRQWRTRPIQLNLYDEVE